MVKNNVPEGWRVERLGNVFSEIKNGCTLKQNKEKVGIPVTRIETIQNNLFDKTRVGYIEDIKNRKLLDFIYRKGDISLSHINDIKHIGKTALYNGDCGELVHGMNLLRLRGDFSFNFSKFLFYEMQSEKFRNDLRSVSRHSVNQASVNQTSLKTLSLVYPESKELQEKIVAEIEKEFSRLDESERELEGVLEKLSLYRKVVLKRAFDNGNFSEKKRLEDITKIITSGSRDWKKYYDVKGALFVRTQNINKNRLDLSNVAYVNLPSKAEGKRSLIEKGDLLVIITGANVCKIAVIDKNMPEAYVSQSVGLIKLKDPESSKFIQSFLLAVGHGGSQLSNLVYGIGRPILSLRGLRSLIIPICSSEEQEKIVQEIDYKFSIISSVESEIRDSLKKIERLKKSVLKSAFEGRLMGSEA